MSIIDPDLIGVMGALVEPRETIVDLSTRTGIVSLDLALGGRLPVGAIEIYGDAGVGKTSMLYQIIVTAQREGMGVALCASEYLDIPYMKTFGVDLDSLVIITGNTGEAVFSRACDFAYSHKDIPCVVAVDSGTSLRPEVDEFANWRIMIEDFLETCIPILGPKSCIAMTNQVRVKKSLRESKFFLNETDSSARKISELFSTRLELSRTLVDEKTYEMVIDIVSNAYSIPGRVLEVPVVKGKGIDVARDVIRAGKRHGFVETKAAWHYWDGMQIGNGELEAARCMPEWAAAKLLDQLRGRA